MMKKLFTIILVAVCFLAEAQVQVPAASPAGSVSSVVGLTTIKVDYSRPRVKGRKVFGESNVMHKYGEIWRTGANNGTKISFSDDVTVEGIKVPKGEYLVLSWPGATEWTVSLYKDVSLGGNTAGYKKENEAANFKVKTEKLATNVETFTISIDDIAEDNKSAKVTFSWENVAFRFGVAVDFDAKVMKSIDDNTKVNPNAYAQAASYYYEAGKDQKKALEFIDLSIASNPTAFWNVHLKAKIQQKLGDKKGALATAQQSLDLAKKNAGGDFGYTKLNEDLIKSLK
jgi:tetratricopeptide (TPR) repeat protein